MKLNLVRHSCMLAAGKSEGIFRVRVIGSCVDLLHGKMPA